MPQKGRPTSTAACTSARSWTSVALRGGEPIAPQLGQGMAALAHLRRTNSAGMGPVMGS